MSENNRVIQPVTESSELKTSKSLVLSDDLSFIFTTTLNATHRYEPQVLEFLRSYLECRDVKQASAEAGITVSQARTLLNKRDVYECVKKVTEQMMFRGGIDPDELVKKVKEVVDVDPLELQNSDGSFKEHLADVSPELRRAIKKFKAKNLYGMDQNGMQTVVGKIIEVEFWDKLKSAEMLGRDVGKFKETKRVEHDVTETMKEALLAVRDRVESLGKGGAIDVTPSRVEDEKIEVVEVLPVKRTFPKPPGVV